MLEKLTQEDGNNQRAFACLMLTFSVIMAISSYAILSHAMDAGEYAYGDQGKTSLDNVAAGIYAPILGFIGFGAGTASAVSLGLSIGFTVNGAFNRNIIPFGNLSAPEHTK